MIAIKDDIRLSEFKRFWENKNIKYFISSSDVQQSLNRKLI